jgi:porin
MTLHPSVHRFQPINPVRKIILCMVLAGIVLPSNAQSPPDQRSTASKTTDEVELSSSDTADDSWGAVPTTKASLVNAAPVLLPYFNNGPVFGIAGTDVSDVWHRTHLTGDWGGVRTNLVRHGFFLDLYSTSAYQGTATGGLKNGSAFIQNAQLSINVDTGRAGLWPGGLLHITLQLRYGSSPQDTFTAGSTVPQYYGLTLPGPFLTHEVLPTEYFLLQSLGQRFSVMLGKITVLTICDQTLFGNSFKYYFANFNFNKNPQALNFYNPTSLAAIGVWRPANWATLAGGVLDPNSQANNLASRAFDRVNIYAASIFSYSVHGLPGQSWAQFNWTNKPKINLGTPFGALSPGENSEAVGVLLGSPATQGLPIRFKPNSWVTIGNFSQYIFVKEDARKIARTLQSGQPLRGIGVFGRVGYAPKETNTISRDASLALFAHGLVRRRREDSFGAGFFYNAISRPLKQTIAQLTPGAATVKDERGTEVFYDFAITPAIQLTPSYQHIWNPLTAQVDRNQRRADVFLARLSTTW